MRGGAHGDPGGRGPWPGGPHRRRSVGHGPFRRWAYVQVDRVPHEFPNFSNTVVLGACRSIEERHGFCRGAPNVWGAWGAIYRGPPFHYSRPRAACPRAFASRRVHMAIQNVGVLGCGLMGSGIAQVAAQAGFRTAVVEANDELLQKGLSTLRKTLDGLVNRGKLEAKTKDDMLARIRGTTRLEDLKDCDIVVEAITENQPLKNETFARLDRACAPHAILASNTSSCNVTAMAAATKRPGQVLGLHFFNPVPLMKLVEVVRTILTDD